MSATGRGSERVEFDRYETPEYTVKSLLDNHKIMYPVLECSCGNRSISKHLELQKSVFNIDIDPSVNPDLAEDYLKYECRDQFKTILTNPPYKHAMEFVEKAIHDVKYGGEVIMLLRINFLESLKRHTFWKINPPSHVYILSKRPSFNGKGTDATGYMWCVWTKGHDKKSVFMDWV